MATLFISEHTIYYAQKGLIISEIEKETFVTKNNNI
jgi:hypothetical protein